MDSIFTILSPAFLAVVGLGGGGRANFTCFSLNLSVIPSPKTSRSPLQMCCFVNFPILGLYFFKTLIDASFI